MGKAEDVLADAAASIHSSVPGPIAAVLPAPVMAAATASQPRPAPAAAALAPDAPAAGEIPLDPVASAVAAATGPVPALHKEKTNRQVLDDPDDPREGTSKAIDLLAPVKAKQKTVTEDNGGSDIEEGELGQGVPKKVN